MPDPNEVKPDSEVQEEHDLVVEFIDDGMEAVEYERSVAWFKLRTIRLRVLNEVLHGMKEGYSGMEDREYHDTMTAIHRAIASIASDTFDSFEDRHSD